MIERLRAAMFDLREHDDTFSRGWNAAIGEAIRIVERVEQGEQLRVALHELAACDVDRAEGG